MVQYHRENSESEQAVRTIAQQTGLSEMIARLLYVRGYQTPQAAERFFKMEAETLHNPFLMKDMEKAVLRLEQALERHEKVFIYGDYDVDGVTSVSLLYLYISQNGGDVDYYIPGRTTEGYGVSRPAIDKLAQRGADLMITVDTGITAIEETEYAKSLGIDVIVTDHHECRPELPDACAVVNPHREDDTYPFKELAGVGVAFKFACAMELSRCKREGLSQIDGIRNMCRTYSDLAALGTVADVMPVQDENRLIIAMGTRLMETNCRVGIRALIDAATASRNGGKNKQKKITSTYIGFTLAPRMNAAGRVSRASIAVELLLSETREEARKLAERLCELNTERQAEENRISESAYRKIEEMPEEERKYVLILDDDSWHQGVIGIVSSRITERYGLPSILISYDGSVEGTPSASDIGKGSGRSIKGLNLVEALIDSEDLLVRFGGHELAAGLSIRRGDVPEFRRRINRYASDKLDEEALCFSVDADCEVEPKELTMKLATDIERLEPFGVSNPVPNFVLRDVKILKILPMGGGKHLRMTLEKDGIIMNAVWFGTGLAALPFEITDDIDILFQLNLNEYQNTVSLQLIVQDAKLSQTAETAFLSEVERYREIKSGADYSVEESVLPDRNDVAVVYTYLKKEARIGHTSFPIRRLMGVLRTRDGKTFGYAKLKFIIRIMQELEICGVTEPVPDHFVFDMYYSAKTNLEKSSILHKLRSQLKK